MRMQRHWRAFLPLIIAGIAVISFSTAGIAAIMGWRPASTAGSGKSVALHHSAEVADQAVALTAHLFQRRAKARANGNCAECGVIVSMGEINRHDNDAGMGAAGELTHVNRDRKLLNTTIRHEMIVRMTDGSNRVIHSAGSASWRVGGRVIVIAGTMPSQR